MFVPALFTLALSVCPTPMVDGGAAPCVAFVVEDFATDESCQAAARSIATTVRPAGGGTAKVVHGRREHRDHWSGMPIAAGELHVVRKEIMDGEFLTTRHSRETLWMSWAGGFGSARGDFVVQPVVAEWEDWEL